MSGTVLPFVPPDQTILFERPAPVKVRSPDREERVEDLVLRISMGTSKSQMAARSLRVQLSSEEDPYFLHSMDLGEDDFQMLKLDQGILVDFGAFPGKLIELVEACISAKDTQRFCAVLTTRGSADSSFAVVETNQFKHLPHIQLTFRPGNDVGIKQYLAGRLYEVKGERATLSSRLATALAQLEVSQREGQSAAAELASERAQHVQALADLRSSLASQAAEARERSAEELASLKERLDKDRADAERKLTDRIELLTRRAEELETENRSLMDQKYKLDGRVSELASKLGSAEGELRALREATERLSSLNGRMDVEKAEGSRTANELRIQLSSAEQRAKDKEEMVVELKARLEEAEGHKRTIEGTVLELKRAFNLAEERLAAATGEVLKGNQIIERLQAEIRSAKAKLKLKAAVITQQENLLTERQGALDKALREAQRLQGEMEAARADRETLQRRVEEQKRKLEESQGLLQSNQQMIQWLNGQVTEAQLGKFSPAATRFSFRPSTAPTAPPPPPAAVSGSAEDAAARAVRAASATTLASTSAPNAAPATATAPPSSAAATPGVSAGYTPGKYAAQYYRVGVSTAPGAGAGVGTSASAAPVTPTPSAFLLGPAPGRS